MIMVKIIERPDRDITVEEHSALSDFILNLITPIGIWANIFLTADTGEKRERAAIMLIWNCKEIEEKVKNFKCTEHCFPIFKEKCNELNRPTD